MDRRPDSVTAAIDCTPYAKATPDAIHHHPRERTTRMTTPTNPPAGETTTSTPADNVPPLAPALSLADLDVIEARAAIERLRRSRDTWERVEAETRAEMHTRLAEHRDAVEVLKLRLSEVAAERDRARSVAVALEAEVERLRAGIEERVVGWSSYRTDPASLTAASCAESLRRLLTPPDAQEPAQEPRTGAGGPGVPDEGCEAVSGQQWGVVEAPQDGGE